ncbi:AAA family ATPase [Patescibacteria group bacterium]|nr:AAA family ATPase [Patescibacteria group bacterium]
MVLAKLTLQNFRSYSKKIFEFNPGATLIVGPNAIGKTNIVEAVYLLATGKSFRAENEHEMIKVGQQVSRLVGQLGDNELEVDWDARERFVKTYKVNGVGKRQADFVGNLRAVLFSPQDIELVTDGPAVRRRYLDSVLEQIYKDYRLAAHIYEKALRQRNRLLWRIREEGISREQLVYWNNLLITNGQVIHNRRKDYLEFLGLTYDSSVISAERLAKYALEEVAAATTLVGPQRDDFIINHHDRPVKAFGSRGEQRLAVFNIKLKELEYVREITGTAPVLLLDDIFSELDHANRHHILEVIPKQQTIMTTTDLHLVDRSALRRAQLIELG